jgi:predicted ABC-class ATPase
MQTASELKKALQRIDGKGYKAYKDIQGAYQLEDFVLFIDNVQSDPFAPPSRVRLRCNQDAAGFPSDCFANRSRKIALEDSLTRSFLRAIAAGDGERGAASSVSIDRPGQEILERTSMEVDANRVEARFAVGLPARGRTILGRKAHSVLLEEIPRIARASLFYEHLDKQALWRHICRCEDQDALREQLADRGLVAFVGNGSVLPRASGVSDKPLTDPGVIPFASPRELEVSFSLPHGGEVKGMGLRKGVSLIVGGGYHGKSTLLKALERGVYNHVPGDGRDLVVTEGSAVKIRAEDGRSVTGVDIQPFISDLPFGQGTSFFSSDNASGSTSQAANIVEALEADCRLLLLDEDTSATNFMIRDSRMQHLVAKENEPITPFIDRVQEMSSRFGVSTVLVLGGSGDYFDVADTVIMLKEYAPFEVTGLAKELVERYVTERQMEIKAPLEGVTPRCMRARSFSRGPKDKVKAKGLHSIAFGKTGVNLAFVEQLVDESQTRAIAEVFRLLGEEPPGESLPLAEVVDRMLSRIREKGLDCLSPFAGKHPGNLALPRKQEICAALNRWRRLQVRQGRD